MEQSKRQSSRTRFGSFELDLISGELSKQGHRVKLQEQPFQLLTILLERREDVVTREELQKKLWPADTFVDFERGLNRAMNKLREALGDEAENPRFIETLPKRGYRFIAPVTSGEAHVPATAPANGPGWSLHSASVTPPAPLVPSVSKFPPNPQAEVPKSRRAQWRSGLLWMIAACIAMLALLGYWRPWLTRQPKADKPFFQFDLNVSPDEFSNPAISPDGSRVVFVSRHALTIRRLDQAKSTQLPGTEGAFLPFFSPSGKWVAYFARDRLLKVAVEGGVPVDLCRAPSPAGGTWIDEEHIVASLDANHEGLTRIPAAGGQPQPLTGIRSPERGSFMQVWPRTLPGGKGILFAVTDGSAHSSLHMLTFHDGKTKKIIDGPADGRYLAGSFLIYFQYGTLFGAPLNLERLQLAGPAVPLVNDVANPGGFGRSEFDVSETGTLVCKLGREGVSSIASWLYPSGRTEHALPEPGRYLTPRLSPDGDKLAVALLEEGQQKIWVFDLQRHTWTRVTSDAGPELLPTWTPDGEFLAFRSGDGLAWARSDGSGTVKRLSGVSPNAGPWSFSADGKWLSFWPLEPESDLWSAPVLREGGQLHLGAPQVLLQQASSSKGAPAISPDSRWVAYSSNESGRFEIYVAPFLAAAGRAGNGKWPVSNNGGLSPVWASKGRELFFQSLDRHVEVVSYATKGDSFVAGQPRAWTTTRLAGTGFFQAFDVAPDGKRLLTLTDVETAGPETALHVFLNVDDELRRRTSQTRR